MLLNVHGDAQSSSSWAVRCLVHLGDICHGLFVDTAIICKLYSSPAAWCIGGCVLLCLEVADGCAACTCQAHMGRVELPMSDYITDTKTVLDNSLRILQSMVDIAADAGWLDTALTTMRLVQGILQVHSPIPPRQSCGTSWLRSCSPNFGSRGGRSHPVDSLRWMESDKRFAGICVSKAEGMPCGLLRVGLLAGREQPVDAAPHGRGGGRQPCGAGHQLCRAGGAAAALPAPPPQAPPVPAPGPQGNPASHFPVQVPLLACMPAGAEVGFLQCVVGGSFGHYFSSAMRSGRRR